MKKQNSKKWAQEKAKHKTLLIRHKISSKIKLLFPFSKLCKEETSRCEIFSKLCKEETSRCEIFIQDTKMAAGYKIIAPILQIIQEKNEHRKMQVWNISTQISVVQFYILEISSFLSAEKSLDSCYDKSNICFSFFFFALNFFEYRYSTAQTNGCYNLYKVPHHVCVIIFSPFDYFLHHYQV